MGSIKTRIEHEFEQAGHFFYTHPKKVLAVLFAIIALLACQIPNTTVDTSSEALLHKNDPDRLDFNKFRDQFGRSETVIVAARADNIFTPEFFEHLRALTLDLEENVPHVNEVTSLINVRETRGEDDELIVENLTENWPQTPQDFVALKKRVKANPVYLDHVISRDMKTAAIIVETDAVMEDESGPGDVFDGFDETPAFDQEEPSETRYFSGVENAQVVIAVNEIIARHEAENFDLVFSGGPVVGDVFNNTIMHDTKLCVQLACLVNIIFLALLFRRFSGVFFPVFIVLAAMVCTMGLYPVFNVSFKMTSSIVPAFLVAVGVADAVHILAIFYRRLDQGDDREEAICHALGHSGLAIVMTSLTTAAGLLSFSFAELTALAELGIFAAIGVVIALLLTIIMLPSMLALFPIKPKTKAKRRTMLMDRFLLFFADFSTARPWTITIICTVLLVVPACFLPTLVFSDNIVSYFPEEMPVRKNILDLDKRLNGVITLEAVIDFGHPDALHEPEALNNIKALTQKIKKIRVDGLFTGKVFSINDVVREINQAMYENDPAYYQIPDNRHKIAQELLLFENSGSDDLERIVDSQFSKTRITIKTPWADSVLYEEYIKQVRAAFKEIFRDSATLTVTGEMALMAKAIPAALRSMTKSYAIAFVVITIMMLLLVGDMKTGLVAMFPNILPIVLVMGFIAYLDITLNLNTLMIGSIAMGLVVDDTMHFMYNYRRAYESGLDAKKAVRHTLLGTGRALLITSVVLSAGFLVLLAGTLKTSIQFGFFTSLIIMLALFVDFILAPALMMILSGKKALT